MTNVTAQISEEERKKRIEAVNFARGSVRLEGFVLTPEVEALTARHINGEFTAKELTAEILKLYKK